MTPRREAEATQIDPDVAELVAALYFALEDNLARCARLTKQRETGAPPDELKDEALKGALRIAYLERVMAEVMTYRVPVDTIPQSTLPIGLHGALARLSYALVALAEPDCEPEALLTPKELEQLPTQYRIEDWLAARRRANPDAPR